MSIKPCKFQRGAQNSKQFSIVEAGSPTITSSSFQLILIFDILRRNESIFTICQAPQRVLMHHIAQLRIRMSFHSPYGRPGGGCAGPCNVLECYYSLLPFMGHCFAVDIVAQQLHFGNTRFFIQLYAHYAGGHALLRKPLENYCDIRPSENFSACSASTRAKKRQR